MRAVLLIVSFTAPVVWAQTTGVASPSAPSSDDLFARSPSAACVDSLEDDVVGLDAVGAACPGLETALLDDGYAAFLSREQIERLSRRSLKDLLILQERYSEPTSAGALSPDTANLGPVLEGLAKQSADTRQGWLARFKEWLRERFSRLENKQDSWLSRWLEDFTLSRRATEALFYGVVVLVIATALAVLFNEARVAGLFRRRRREAGQRVFGSTQTRASSDAPLDLDSASANAQPVLLLRMLVGALVSTGRLCAERSLTHRELSSRAAFDDADQRASFQRVAELAERMLYGHGAAPAEAAQIVSEGRTLFARLNASGS